MADLSEVIRGAAIVLDGARQLVRLIGGLLDAVDAAPEKIDGVESIQASSAEFACEADALRERIKRALREELEKLEAKK